MSGTDERVQKALDALCTSEPFAIHRLDRERLREVLIKAACPIVCTGQRRPETPGSDWHEWCERKADAALAIIYALDPPPLAATGTAE
jgi:hypothetical protein